MKLKDLLLIFLAAAAVRLAAMFIFGANSLIGPDSAEYDTYALNLLRDHYFHYEGFRSFRAPLYPFFLAAVYYVFGHSYFVVKLIQVVLGSLTCVLAYMISRRMAGEKAARLTGLICTFYFALFDNSAYISTETLFTFLLALSVYMTLAFEDSKGAPFAAGVCAALSALTRPTTLLFPGAALVWFLYKKGFRKAAAPFLLLCAGFLLTLAPWTARNYAVHKAFVPVNIMGGDGFWVTNNPWSRGRQCQVMLDHAQFAGLSEVERDRACFREGIKWWRSQTPAQLARMYALKFSSFFYPFLPEFKAERGGSFVFAFDPTFGFIIPFWLFGMYVSLRRGDEGGLLLAMVTAIFLLFTLVYYGGETRFRTAYSPYVAAFAAAGLLKTFEKTAGRAFAAAWGALNILAFFFSGRLYSAAQEMLSRIRS